MKFTYIIFISSIDFKLFFHIVSFIIITPFTPSRETLYADRFKFLLNLQSRVSARRRTQNGFLGEPPSAGLKDGDPRVLNGDCGEDKGEHSTTHYCKRLPYA